ncbi:MAG: hypothetical protein GXY44_00570 [Phycisphaerales bacterium]|nr:hypothetical protein [Phycisphaerales bacterium]
MPQTPPKSIEQIVAELGRYPIDAFMFVQECIAHAAENVHGPMSEDEKTVAQWMTKEAMDFPTLAAAYHENSLPPEIRKIVDRIGGAEKLNRHVTGQQLCWAFRDAALARWGLMSRTVLAHWKITRTEDIGVIIFALVDHGWLQKQPTDLLEDFSNVFDFDEVFERVYRMG